MKNTGKTTLITKLIKESHHTCDVSVNPLPNSMYKPTSEMQPITITLFINGRFYECTFIDTPGLSHKSLIFDHNNDIRQQLCSIDKLNLILFVFKYGQPNTDAISVISDVFKGPIAQHSHVSAAAVITFCDTLINDDYEDITREFISNPCSKQFSIDVGRRVYPIGFPNTVVMKETAAELSRKFIQKNISKLHQLIEASSGGVPAKDVLRDQRCSMM